MTLYDAIARGGELIAVARFVPGGRTAVTLTAGLSHFSWRRFALYDAIASAVWAGYGACLGFFGGRAFENQPWKGLLLALGAAITVSVGAELIRWLVRSLRTVSGQKTPEESSTGVSWEAER